MPILPPNSPASAVGTTFQDHLNRVALVLGNRNDLLAGTPSRIMGWIRDSYINLAMSYEHDTLEQTTTGQLAAGTDNIPYPADARAIDAITLYDTNSGVAIQPDFKDMQYLRMFNTLATAQGPPSVWAPQNGKIYFRPIPKNTYSLIIDYWQLPQIQDPNGNVVNPYESGTDISATPVLLPYDWLEILDYGAEMRGHAELLEREKAQEIQQLLFGFTIPLTGKFVPGMIGQILMRRQAQAPRSDYGIQPRTPKRSFTNVP